MTQILREHCGLELAAAKSVTDRVLDGKVVEVQTPTLQVAQQLASELIKLDADAAVGPAV